MIDTGGCNSITPNSTDLTGEKKRLCLQSLKQVNGTTPVCKEGEVLWDIEDFYETCQSIVTESYYVPNATICFFFHFKFTLAPTALRI